jgi:hypothetical protein
MDVSIGAFDGMRCLAVLLAKGAPWIAEQWQPAQTVTEWLHSRGSEAKSAIAEYCKLYSADASHAQWTRMIASRIPGLMNS